MSAEKRDLFTENKSEYKATRKPAQVSTALARYLAIEGKGRPGDDVFVEQVGALYAMAYTTKMRLKAAGGGDYAVGKLEALWPDEPAVFADPKSAWRWTLLIRSPEFLREADLEPSRTALRDKKKEGPFEKVGLIDLDEGTCIQILHVGPYDDEKSSLALMKSFAAEKSLLLKGPHHEIYLSDPRRVPPARLKTILRVPAAKLPEKALD